MLTQCPRCGTTFRVSPPQLKARAGTVRCGQCSHVFNALDTLANDPAKTDPTAQPVEESPLPTPSPEAPPTEEGVISTSRHETPPASPPPETTQASPLEELPLESSPEPGAATTSAATDYLAEPLLHEASAPARRWPWVLSGMIALLGLLAQATYYYRVELAVLRPELRPLLQAACVSLRCEVPRPRNIELLGIETSDLRPDPQQPGHLTLLATLRSKAPFAQEWPLLELTLTDVADRKLAVRGFAPDDYLPKEKHSAAIIAAGFPANGEIAVSLPLDVGDLPAAGYRLYIFYP